jgi:hypothetical protein
MRAQCLSFLSVAVVQFIIHPVILLFVLGLHFWDHWAYLAVKIP